MNKLLIDLRGNLGSYVDQATQIAEQMLEAGKLILYTKGKAHQYNTEHEALIALVILQAAKHLMNTHVQIYDHTAYLCR